MPASFSGVKLTKNNASQLHNKDYGVGVTSYLVGGKVDGPVKRCGGGGLGVEVDEAFKRAIIRCTVEGSLPSIAGLLSALHCTSSYDPTEILVHLYPIFPHTPHLSAFFVQSLPAQTLPILSLCNLFDILLGPVNL